MKKIQDVQVSGKKVLVRVDYNVPIGNGLITDNERIVASLETINYLMDHGAAIILCSHLDQPKGRPNPLYSLKPVAAELGKLINKSVQFSGDCLGKERGQKVSELKPGEVLLLENVRFYPGEEKNDPNFAEDLAEGCDLYVNDAFSVSHREHASVVAVTKNLDSFAGLFLQKEFQNLSRLIFDPKRPFFLILGGAKITDKIQFLNNLMDRIDTLIVGGAVANTFLLAKGNKIGQSVAEAESVGVVRDLLETAENRNIKVFLPEDVIVANSINDIAGQPKLLNQISDHEVILDIGESTIARYSSAVEFAETIFWNGPMGLAETPAFARGTKLMGQAVANTSAFSIIGGGDTVASLDSAVRSQFDYVSVAGGASLKFLSDMNLPGLVVLQ
jgi:3-phosphoglycerate kinase